MALNPNELRRGNYVDVSNASRIWLADKSGVKTWSTAQWAQVEVIRKDAIIAGGFHCMENGHSIPITPENLYKAGFIKIQSGSMSHPEEWEIRCKIRLVEYSFKISGRGSSEWYWIEGNVIVELYSLHQLQNLYFDVTGEELKIEL